MPRLESLALYGSGAIFLPTYHRHRAEMLNSASVEAAQPSQLTLLPLLTSLSVTLSDGAPIPIMDRFVKCVLDRAPNIEELVAIADVVLKRVCGTDFALGTATASFVADGTAAAVQTAALDKSTSDWTSPSPVPALRRLTAICIKDGASVTDPELQALLKAAPGLRFREIRRMNNFVPFVPVLDRQRGEAQHGPLYRPDMWTNYRHAALRRLIIQARPWSVAVPDADVAAFEAAALEVCPWLRVAQYRT
jgi:hypothetical protein